MASRPSSVIPMRTTTNTAIVPERRQVHFNPVSAPARQTNVRRGQTTIAEIYGPPGSSEAVMILELA